VGFQIPFVDAPPTPRRDIAIIGLYSVLFESPVTSEVTGVLSEYSLVEIAERRLSVAVVGDDTRPAVVSTVAGGPLGEPLELATCISAIVPAIAAAALSFVLQIPFERIRQRPSSAVRGGSIVDHAVSPGPLSESVFGVLTQIPALSEASLSVLTSGVATKAGGTALPPLLGLFSASVSFDSIACGYPRPPQYFKMVVIINSKATVR
jgi:hypothetical protein